MPRILRVLLLVVITALLAPVPAGQAQEPARPPSPEALAGALAHWQDLRFGLFIHWGPVSLTGREIGWSRVRIPSIP